MQKEGNYILPKYIHTFEDKHVEFSLQKSHNKSQSGHMIIWPPILGSQTSMLQREQQSYFKSNVCLGESPSCSDQNNFSYSFSYGRSGSEAAISSSYALKSRIFRTSP